MKYLSVIIGALIVLASATRIIAPIAIDDPIAYWASSLILYCVGLAFIVGGLWSNIKRIT